MKRALIVLTGIVAGAGLTNAQETERASPSAASQPQGAAAPLEQRIAEQRAHLDELLQHYTEKHPAVALASRQLEQLEAQRREEDTAAPTNE